MAQKQLGKPDKLDKYRNFLFEGAELSEEQLLMLSRYRKAYNLASLGFSRNQVLSALEKEYELSTPQLYAIIRESTELYGSVAEIDRKGRRQISIERYELLANLARKDGNYAAAIRAQENADKLQGLFEPEKAGMDPKAFLVPVPMMFTTDPAVLREQQQEDTDYTDYEDAE
ncbi:hypothetical protein [uncultured Hymenobacter sp.]|uniref:hypothetical protein n=1 Tax=uncultured Hymenobacter sp. TaxID=170016 RepID=UPI0035CC474E